MASNSAMCELSDLHDSFGIEYRGINRYLSKFQVKLPRSDNQALSHSPNFTVFKRKNLGKVKLVGNIYHSNLSTSEVIDSDTSVSKVSCSRCRKYKKKCSRQFPECSNCIGSEELCTYLPRKKKKTKAALYTSCHPVDKSTQQLKTNTSIPIKKHGNDLDRILN